MNIIFSLDGGNLYSYAHQLKLDKRIKKLESILEKILPSIPESEEKLDEENYDFGKLITVAHQYMLEARVEKLECVFSHFIL